MPSYLNVPAVKARGVRVMNEIESHNIPRARRLITATAHGSVARTCPFGAFTSGQIIAFKGELPPIRAAIQRPLSALYLPHGTRFGG